MSSAWRPATHDGAGNVTLGGASTVAAGGGHGDGRNHHNPPSSGPIPRLSSARKVTSSKRDPNETDLGLTDDLASNISEIPRWPRALRPPGGAAAAVRAVNEARALDPYNNGNVNAAEGNNDDGFEARPAVAGVGRGRGRQMRQMGRGEKCQNALERLRERAKAQKMQRDLNQSTTTAVSSDDGYWG